MDGKFTEERLQGASLLVVTCAFCLNSRSHEQQRGTGGSGPGPLAVGGASPLRPWIPPQKAEAQAWHLPF